MSIFGISESDKEKLEAALVALKKLHEELSNKYSLRSDLVEINDRRYSLGSLLAEELHKIKGEQQKLENKTNELSDLKVRLEESISTTAEIEALLKKDENGISRYTRILEITSEKNLKDLENNSNEILEIYRSLFTGTEKETSKIEQIKREIESISLNYEKFFKEEIDEDGGTRFEELNDIYGKYKKYYAELFESSDQTIKSRKDQINDQLNKIQNFYDKIYGNEVKNINSLEKVLEEQLNNLKDVEERAKSVIGLSSEAGLAGGFSVKGREAKKGQLISISVFVLITCCIFGFNLYLFDKNDFFNLKWDTLLFKLMINAPLIWIATIANINLNKLLDLTALFTLLVKIKFKYLIRCGSIQTLMWLNGIVKINKSPKFGLPIISIDKRLSFMPHFHERSNNTLCFAISLRASGFRKFLVDVILPAKRNKCML